MTEEILHWGHASKHLQSPIRFAGDSWEHGMEEEFLIKLLQDIANSPWMQQRAKDGKQVILAGKG